MVWTKLGACDSVWTPSTGQMSAVIAVVARGLLLTRSPPLQINLSLLGETQHEQYSPGLKASGWQKCLQSPGHI